MVSDLTGLELLDIATIHAVLLGQTAFLILWARLPWWREWVGRALMVKSAAFWVLVAVYLVNWWISAIWGPYAYLEHVRVASRVVVLIGVMSQVVALGYEMRRANVGDRSVTGTAKHREAEAQS